jgi:hypothetical protein
VLAEPAWVVQSSWALVESVQTGWAAIGQVKERRVLVEQALLLFAGHWRRKS